MLRTYAPLAFLLLTWISLCQAQEKPTGEEVFGEWEVVEMIYKGTVQEIPKRAEFVYLGKDGFGIGPESPTEPGFKCIFPKTGEIDITFDKRYPDIQAVYQLKGDELRIYWHSSAKRPTEFDALKDKGLTMRVLKRVAK